MLDIFPSVETVTSLNSFVRDAVVTKEVTESRSGNETQSTNNDLEEEELDENIGTNINIQI